MVKKGAFHFEKSYSIMYGHLKKCHSVTSLEVQVGGGTEVFIKVDKKQEWLLKAMTAGKGHKKSSLKRVTLLDQLRNALTQKVTAAEPEPVETDETDTVNDPINRLDPIGPQVQKNTR